MRISDLTGMSWHAKKKLAHRLGIPVTELEATLTLQTEAWLRLKQITEPSHPPMLDETPVHRCECGAWAYADQSCTPCHKMREGK